jgi:hypothetical protein
VNIGKIYRVKKYFWLLYSAKDGVAGVRQLDHVAQEAVAKSLVVLLRNRYSCDVTYFSPDSYIVFLEQDGEYYKILTADGLIGRVLINENHDDCFEEKTE